MDNRGYFLINRQRFWLNLRCRLLEIKYLDWCRGLCFFFFIFNLIFSLNFIFLFLLSRIYLFILIFLSLIWRNFNLCWILRIILSCFDIMRHFVHLRTQRFTWSRLNVLSLIMSLIWSNIGFLCIFFMIYVNLWSFLIYGRTLNFFSRGIFQTWRSLYNLSLFNRLLTLNLSLIILWSLYICWGISCSFDYWILFNNRLSRYLARRNFFFDLWTLNLSRRSIYI